MADEVGDVDINEVFEHLLLAEDKAKETGFKEGYSAGENQPVKGYHLGYHRAWILASQLGYYSSVIEHCFNHKHLLSSKLLKQAQKLYDEIEKFPKKNGELIDILQNFRDIKLKFAKLCSITKINLPYREAEKLDF